MTAAYLGRDAFREGVFARDGHKCVICGAPAVDAHHIIERRLFKEPHEMGGYFLNNGSSLCAEHHLAAEMTTLSVEEIRDACGIRRAVLPDHLYDDQAYTKWGDPIMGNGQRIKGELFWDESVQKILGQGRVLNLYTDLVRAPRTNHVPWSPGINDDDRVLKDMRAFEEAGRMVVTCKRDGGNTTGYPNGFVHARSPDGNPHPSMAMVKSEIARFAHDLPEGWRIGGENLYRKHSIFYDDLPSFFMGFHLWNDRNVLLPWGETLEYFELLGVNPVDEIYRGPYDQRILEAIVIDTQRNEGWVARVEGEIPYGGFQRMCGKWVRPDHNHLHNSRNAPIVPNVLGPARPVEDRGWHIDARKLGPALAAQVAATGAIVR